MFDEKGTLDYAEEHLELFERFQSLLRDRVLLKMIAADLFQSFAASNDVQAQLIFLVVVSQEGNLGKWLLFAAMDETDESVIKVEFK